MQSLTRLPETYATLIVMESPITIDSPVLRESTNMMSLHGFPNDNLCLVIKSCGASSPVVAHMCIWPSGHSQANHDPVKGFL